MEHESPASWRMAMLSHVGRVRARNEDFVFCDEVLGVAALADGMGGHAGGDVAARLAVDAWVGRIRKCPVEPVGERDLRVAVADANRVVFAAACADPALRRMGTTLVAACFRSDDTLLTCNVGDSRLYRLRGDVPADHRLMQEEVFGPVLCAMRFKDEDEAVELANATRFGLAAGIWTADGARQFRMARRVRSGQVFINNYGAGGGVELPFGGVKSSGYGREKGFEALYGFTQIKTISMKHD